jgi:hypothetical protein
MTILSPQPGCRMAAYGALWGAIVGGTETRYAGRVS